MNFELGGQPPRVHAPLPGETGRRWVDMLARYECPALTARRMRRAETSGAPHDPIVWHRARGANVVDTDGNVYIDLTAGFGAAAIGHAHPRVVSAIREQSDRLVHALGDVHPSDVKARLLERLAGHAPWDDARVVLGLGGADSVEAALKTAMLATGRAGVVAFEGGYHGLSHGPLAACGFKPAMRAPFEAQLNPHVTFAPWPSSQADPDEACRAVADVWDGAAEPIGAVVVEPVQGRGGVRLPPDGFLARLRALCHTRGAVLIADEILTGLGRCGARWRSVTQGALPDLVCAGKALGAGMPVSACLGRPDVMAAWGDPGAEALHTGTFFGHPLACAAALAALAVLEEDDLATRAAQTGRRLVDALRTASDGSEVVREVRGAGLLVGIELETGSQALQLVRALLESGYLVLPAGARGQVVQLLPPLDIGWPLLDGFVETFQRILPRL